MNLYTYCANNPLIYIDPTGNTYVPLEVPSEYVNKHYSSVKAYDLAWKKQNTPSDIKESLKNAITIAIYDKYSVESSYDKIEQYKKWGLNNNNDDPILTAALFTVVLKNQPQKLVDIITASYEVGANHATGYQDPESSHVAANLLSGYFVGKITEGAVKSSINLGNIKSVNATDDIINASNSSGKKFYTIQSEVDAKRLLNGGNPWPSADSRAALGEGVYAWETEKEAMNYLKLIQKRDPNAKILEFSVLDSDLENLKSLNIDLLTDEKIELFMSQYSKLWGGTPNHGLEYIQRGTNMGIEHFFDKSIFNLIKFKN